MKASCAASWGVAEALIEFGEGETSSYWIRTFAAHNMTALD